MRRPALLLGLLLPLTACGSGERLQGPASAGTGPVAAPTVCGSTGPRVPAPSAEPAPLHCGPDGLPVGWQPSCPVDPAPPPSLPPGVDTYLTVCTSRDDDGDGTEVVDQQPDAPSPAVAAEPPRAPSGTVEAASQLLSDLGGELALVRGTTPSEVLAQLAPGAEQTDRSAAQRRLERGGYEHSTLVATQLGRWTLVHGVASLSMADPAVVERLSARGAAVRVRWDVDALGSFVLARDGRTVRAFEPLFHDDPGEGTGRPLPQEAGLGWDVVRGHDPLSSALRLAERLTGVRITGDLLTATDGRLAVLVDGP